MQIRLLDSVFKHLSPVSHQEPFSIGVFVFSFPQSSQKQTSKHEMFSSTLQVKTCISNREGLPSSLFGKSGHSLIMIITIITHDSHVPDCLKVSIKQDPHKYQPFLPVATFKFHFTCGSRSLHRSHYSVMDNASGYSGLGRLLPTLWTWLSASSWIVLHFSLFSKDFFVPGILGQGLGPEEVPS